MVHAVGDDTDAELEFGTDWVPPQQRRGRMVPTRQMRGDGLTVTGVPDADRWDSLLQATGATSITPSGTTTPPEVLPLSTPMPTLGSSVPDAGDAPHPPSRDGSANEPMAPDGETDLFAAPAASGGTHTPVPPRCAILDDDVMPQRRPTAPSDAAVSGHKEDDDTEAAEMLRHGAVTVQATPHLHPPRRNRRVIIALAAALALMVAITAGVLLGPLRTHTARPDEPPSGRSGIDVPGIPNGEPITVQSYDGPSAPGYSTAPAWSVTPSPGTRSAATPLGLVLVDKDQLKILSLRDGQQAAAAPLAGPVQFVSTTMMDGAPAVVWRAGDRLTWFDGGAISGVDLPPNAQVSSAGRSLVITAEDRTAATVIDGRLIRIPIPADQVVLSSDGDIAFSADDALNLWRWSLPQLAPTPVTLAVPADGLKLVRLLTAGHAMVASVWAEVSSPQGQPPALVATHDSAGRLLSARRVSASIAMTADWQRTIGSEVATLDRLSINLRTGRIEAWCDTCTMRGGFGPLFQTVAQRTASTPGGAGFLLGSTLWLTDNRVVAASSDQQIVVLGTGDGFTAYPKSP